MNQFISKYGMHLVTPIALAAVMTGTALAESSPKGRDASGPEVQKSHEAVRIFNDANQAVIELNKGDNAAAQHDVAMAMATRDRLALTARSHNLAKVIPIYTEVEQDTALGPILAKKNEDQATPPAKPTVAVDDVKDQLTFVGVDLDKTKARLQSAREAIQNSNIQAAKDTLNSIGDDLVVEKVSADAPLLAIRENLGLAHVAAAASHSREATTALQEASGELGAYAQSSGSSHQQQARQLKVSIDQLLQSSGQNKAASAHAIGDWWAEVNGWMQTPTA